MKRLGIVVGVAVLAGLLVSSGIGFAASRGMGSGAVAVLRDFSVIILALFTLIGAAVAGGIYFGAAWTLGRFGGKVPAGIRWAGMRVTRVEAAVESGSERFVARPLAATSRATVTGTTFVKRLAGGPRVRADCGHEVSRWRTFLNRVRGRVQLGGRTGIV